MTTQAENFWKDVRTVDCHRSKVYTMIEEIMLAFSVFRITKFIFFV